MRRQGQCVRGALRGYYAAMREGVLAALEARETRAMVRVVGVVVVVV